MSSVVFGSRNIRRIANVSRLLDWKDKQLQRVNKIVNLMIKTAIDGLGSLQVTRQYSVLAANGELDREG
jgi:hypothetical protein